jgi:hypothetical protein
MSRSVVTAEKIKPPKELEVLFDDPPLVGNERREDRERSSRAPWKFISALGPTMRRSDLTFPDKVSDVVLVVRHTPRYPPVMGAVSGKIPGRAGGR